MKEKTITLDQLVRWVGAGLLVLGILLLVNYLVRAWRKQILHFSLFTLHSKKNAVLSSPSTNRVVCVAASDISVRIHPCMR